jgi:hypothetical protein
MVNSHDWLIKLMAIELFFMQIRFLEHLFFMFRVVICLGLVLMASARAAAQSDTTLISDAIAFVNSSEFRLKIRSYQDSILAVQERLFPGRRMSTNDLFDPFWTQTPCFEGGPTYDIAVPSSRIQNRNDSLVFGKYTSHPYAMNELTCSGGMRLLPTLLTDRVIELANYNGDTRKTIFGYLHCVRLQRTGDRWQLCAIRDAILN